MKLRWRDKTGLTVLLGAAVCFAGCAKSGQNSENTLSSQTNTQIETQETEETQMWTKAEESTVNTEETSNSTLVNPIKKATKEDIENMGLTIALPENENWIGEPAYSIINGETAQIKYSDKIAQADVTLRAGKIDIPAMAGIYYPFDDTREESWSARNTKENTMIEIRVQYAITDQSQAGVLLSFSHKDVNYTLWSDITDKKADISPISKTAVYIAEHLQ